MGIWSDLMLGREGFRDIHGLFVSICSDGVNGTMPETARAVNCIIFDDFPQNPQRSKIRFPWPLDARVIFLA
jgi:hypothetical protein